MTEQIQPVLTIGIIFKNEFRCLKRCLESLTPLRKSISCELIMADTGSDDGSREIAATYADILFDFPWIDDFSAARNAVMDKASGQWYLTMDADEFLDSDISELVKFFDSAAAQKNTACSLVQRNYESLKMGGDFSDFMAIRMIKMSLGLRYKGAIHETWYFPEGKGYIFPLSRTILHHDGYAGLNDEQGKLKRARNLALIKKELKRNPKDPARLLQYIESGAEDDALMDIIRRAAELIEKKEKGWNLFGPPIFRYAVREARERSLPELREWISRAWKWFPDSFFTRIDVEFLTFAHEWDQKQYASCISHGIRYLKAFDDYQKESGARTEFMFGSLLCGSPHCRQVALLYLADAYIKEKNDKHALQMLNKLEAAVLDENQVENFVRVLWKIHDSGKENTAAALLHFFKEIQKPIPGKEQAEKRMNAFFSTAKNIFSLHNEETQINNDFKRPSHTLFLPLGESNDLGRAAMILESNDLSDMQKLLSKVESWDGFPIEALSYAIQNGAAFPCPGMPLKLEDADSLAARLAGDKNDFFAILFKAAKEDFTSNFQKLMWTRGLVLIAVRIFDWSPESSNTAGALVDDTKNGVTLARFFAEVEELFLPGYYSQELLQEENILSLPLLHRFGWYCAKAFKALEQGNPRDYVHQLREGLKVSPEMNPMVEYLTRDTPQLQRKPENASPELQLLARQVKTLLSSYPADDPAVAAIKTSPAYQKVAEIIENSVI